MKQVENLDKLAEEIYKEGIEKAESESENIIAEAKRKSETSIKNANQKATDIIKKSEQEAEKISSSALNEVSLKSKQIISDLQESIKSMIIHENFEKPLQGEFEDKDFLGQLILSIAQKFSFEEDIELIVSNEHLKTLDSFLEKKLQDHLAGMEIKTTEIPMRGFQIKNNKAGYYISFTDEAFIELLKPYFSDRLHKILYES
jgi:V/A-type H+-transporting ATPase subunit E